VQIEANQHAFSVRKIADDFPHWLRQLANERRERQDLVTTGLLRVGEQIDDLNVIFAG